MTNIALTTSTEAERARQRIEVIARQAERINSDTNATTADYGILADLFTEQTALTRELEAFESLASSTHPLARMVDLTAEVTPPNWILPHFIQEGIVLIAGGHGVGKTTTLLPLAMAAAGIHEPDYELAPKHWRHVIYVTEDISQAKLIINGWMNEAGLDHEHLVERVHIVEALRMDPMSVVSVGRYYRENFTQVVSTPAGDIELPPLVVIDTMASTFALDNENDNAEASTLIASLKQLFRLPVWIVGHVSKGDLSKQGLNGSTPSLRGASAFEADANQVLYLTKESDDSRWLVRGKSRFESSWHELLIETGSRTYQVQNRFGDYESLTQRWGIARPQEKSRSELAVEARQQESKRAESDKKKLMIDCVKKQEQQSEPVNKVELYKMVGGRSADNLKLITELIDEGWVAEVTVPMELRTHHTRGQFLISLSNGERDDYLATGELPEGKTDIPDCWRKASKSTENSHN